MVDRSLPRMIVSGLVPLLVLAACSQEDVSGPDVQFSHQSPPALNHAVLCKTGPDGTFDIVGGVIATVTLSDGQCAQIATHPGDRSTVTVTITEQPLGPGAALSQVVIEEFLGAAFIPVGPMIAPGPTVSIDLTDDHSFTVTYENVDVSTGGRMTGGGNQVRVDGVRITRGLTLHCDITLSNNLEINWTGANKWHITKPLTSALCLDDPAVDPTPPAAPFDTFIGEATGTLNGASGSVVRFTFVDAGEPGGGDSATIDIWAAGADPNTATPVLSVSGNLDHGNLQAHFDQPHK